MKLPINKFSFSGTFTKETKISGGKILHIEQLVGGKMPSVFPVAVKDECIPSHLKTGSEVYVGNASITRSSKRDIFKAGKILHVLPQKVSLNEADISGIVTEIKSCGNGYALTLKHGEEAPYIYVMAGKAAFDANHITEDDEILIMGGITYQKENAFWIRVTDPSHLILIERGSPDKGIIQAKDKFI